MSHNYLFDTYQYLKQRFDAINPRLADPEADPATRSHAAGQIEALCDLERFLKARYEVKLPRRLRNHETPLNHICVKPD